MIEQTLATALPLLGEAASAYGSWRANQENVALAREDRAWKERMSNTAHQREAADLQAAGLNRILSLGHPGASTPASSPAQVSNIAEGAGHTALAVARLKTELDSLKAGAEKSRADAEVSHESAATAPFQRALLDEQRREASARANIAEAASYSAESKTRAEQDWDQFSPVRAGEIDAVMQRLGPIIQTGAQSIGAGAAFKYLRGGLKAKPKQ